MSADKHTRIVVTVAVTSSMLVAATGVFAWTFTRFTETEGYRYCFPLIVYGTIWMLTVVFGAGVAWSLAEQVGSWMGGSRRPVVRPLPRRQTPPTVRPAPTPTDITLTDMAPIQDITQEIPRVEHAARVPHHLHIPPGQLHLSDWRPPVSSNPKENV